MCRKKILFISSRLEATNKNGAYIVSNRNYKMLQNVSEIKVFNVEMKSKIQRILNIIFLKRCEGISLVDENKIEKIIKDEKINIVFLDTSSYGYLCEKLKKKSGIKIVVFCHDINYFLYKSILNGVKNNILEKFKLKKILKNSEINEKKSFEKADVIITLNKRDSKLLNQKYKIESTIEIPVSFPNKNLDGKLDLFKSNIKNLLFVGVADFFPNMEGLNFFIREVLPHIDANLYIVGKNMEKYREIFENISKKVKVIGTVEKLEDYYCSADAIIAPIFSGGGMKVKTAEALMYGKTVFGTTEAFEGYELDYDKAGGLCNTAEEFIEKINNYIEKDNIKQKLNQYSRDIFLEKYSYNSSEEKFKEIIENIG
ncbi:glycosyltransferase family 4 protein [Cetobacterium sp. 2A]|uniref:glycosyltransferase n=1 Tax=Cetobacterium sp. 2A TaxID=2754723 RepID=UPI00163B73C8|nr:glycosyltransferase [Cetobacterium sp. 2A]MBC2856172.1 glycosyltransferase family 4 protein [Cetobacterium sp. 2A]